MTNLFSPQTKANHTELITKVLIVDDQKVVRTRIEEVLSLQQNIKIVGTADNGEKAISMVEFLEPDVILIDIEMPGMDGIEVIKVLSEQFPELKILVISSHDKEEYVQKTIGTGADGYVLKNASAANLISAIDAVRAGSFYLGEGLLKKIQHTSGSNSSSNSSTSSTLEPKKFLAESESSQNANQLTVNAADRSSKLDLSSDTNIKQLEENLSVVEVEEFLPSIGKWITWGGMAVMIVIALIIPVSSVLKYKTKIRASASIRPEGEVRLVQAKAAGQIIDIAAKSGESIKKGDIIATIDPFELQSQKKVVQNAIAQRKLQLAQLNSQIANLERQTLAESDRSNAEISAAEAELSGNIRAYENTSVEVNSQFDEAQARLKASQATLEAAKTKLTRYSSVAKEGALAKEDIAEVRLEVARQQQEVEAARAALNSARAAQNPSDAEIEITRQQIQQLRKSGLTTVASLNREKEALVQQKIEIKQQIQQDEGELEQINQQLVQTEISATATGIISRLELRNSGQLVQIGQEIAQIIPEQGNLKIRTVVSPQDIGKVEIGQNVQMRVSACSYPDYGVLNGKVSKIDSDVTQTETNRGGNSGNAASPTPNQPNSNSSFYEVTVTPAASSFGRKEFQCKLQVGMQGSAEIITREETALQFILRKARIISNV